ncbi:MAG: site-2 protease family protein [Bryobacteraceae bacterium]|nr:site-2 protease family protein [Bryobacteraceae bacterium]
MDGSARIAEAVVARKTKQRYWINVLLFAITLITTTAVGARMAHNFEYNLPAFTEDDLSIMAQFLRHPMELLRGLPFSLTLLAILMAHEMGHYLACQYYRVNATLPFFLPAPTLIGTLGAFIRIRSPIYTRKALFDVGIAGPLAGFVALLPALAIGLAYSRIIPGIADRGELIFGAPALQRLLEAAIFPGVSSSDIALHPIARAAWVGMLATALNLLPIGQLDGGHILYSFVGRRHKALSFVFVAALIPIGLLSGSYGWLVWAAVLFILGMRHPSIQDRSDLGTGRRKLGALALAIFLLCFTLAPVGFSSGY